jgi:hypothetical protein
VETRTSFRATPARNVRPRQGERIEVGIGHDRQARIGRVVHLEMLGRHLWAVAECDYDLGDGPWRFSVEATSTYQRSSSIGTDITIDGVGVVARTAQISLAPITILPGGLDHRSSWSLPQLEKTLVTNAAEALRDRRHGRPIQVRGLLDQDQQVAMQYAAAAAEYYRSNPLAVRPNMRPAGQIWHSAHRGRVLRVS